MQGDYHDSSSKGAIGETRSQETGNHEKFDGSGYPKGMVGEDIPIYGRILAICDVFDALGSARCYKKAWPDENI